MQVIVGGTPLSLSKNDVIGAGGEGTVFRASIKNVDMAVKIYHKPDTARGNKLKAFLAKNWQLPTDKMAVITDVAYDSAGKRILGLVMPFLGRGFEELASLSNKKYRAAHLINTQMIANIFLDGAHTLKCVHQNGLIIGDFNDLNGLFRGTEMLFIDVDAWQFDTFACPVGTEQFLAPELYGIDLSIKPVFKPEHDWYSYAVMLFKSLLYVHPFGGTHKAYKQLTTRAANNVTVLSPDVIYPKIALSPDLLSDDLAHEFEQIFAKGQRGTFPLNVLSAYRDNLTECPSCGVYYPKARKQCPVCSAATLIIITQPASVTKGINVTEFLRTQGPIVFHKLIGNTLYVIAYEKGKAVLYTKRSSLQAVRQELFNEIPGAKYELIEGTLVVNLPGKTELLLIDINGSNIKSLTKSETTIYAGNRRAIFRTSQRYIFRIIGGSLMYGEITNGRFVERMLRPVSNEQTWFAVQQEDTGDKPTVCGFFQVFREQFWWLVWKGNTYDKISVSELEIGESLTDVTVKFSSQGVLIRRLTQYQGVDYIRTDMVDTNGKVIFNAPRIRQEDHIAPIMHGHAYSTGKLLHATDEGVIQEDVLNNTAKTFDATKGHVEEGNVLYAYQGGLLVVKDTSIAHIMLS